MEERKVACLYCLTSSTPEPPKSLSARYCDPHELNLLSYFARSVPLAKALTSPTVRYTKRHFASAITSHSSLCFPLHASSKYSLILPSGSYLRPGVSDLSLSSQETGRAGRLSERAAWCMLTVPIKVVTISLATAFYVRLNTLCNCH